MYRPFQWSAYTFCYFYCIIKFMQIPLCFTLTVCKQYLHCDLSCKKTTTVVRVNVDISLAWPVACIMVYTYVQLSTQSFANLLSIKKFIYVIRKHGTFYFTKEKRLLLEMIHLSYDYEKKLELGMKNYNHVWSLLKSIWHKRIKGVNRFYFTTWNTSVKFE